MVLQRALLVCRLQLCLSGIRRHAEDVVELCVLHHVGGSGEGLAGSLVEVVSSAEIRWLGLGRGQWQILLPEQAGSARQARGDLPVKAGFQLGGNTYEWRCL